MNNNDTPRFQDAKAAANEAYKLGLRFIEDMQSLFKRDHNFENFHTANLKGETISEDKKERILSLAVHAALGTSSGEDFQAKVEKNFKLFCCLIEPSREHELEQKTKPDPLQSSARIAGQLAASAMSVSSQATKSDTEPEPEESA